MARYAIADVHGCPKTLEALVESVLRLKKSDELFLLGDYIDRGPDSRGVLDLMMKWTQAGYNLKALRGNHEEMVLNTYFTEPWAIHKHLQLYEGLSLLSEDCTVALKYLNFMRDMPYYLNIDGYYLVHAGFNFALENPLSDYNNMLWIRKMEPNLIWLNGKRVVHGHQPFSLNTIKTHVAEKATILPLDNGAVFHLRMENPDLTRYGNLCALDLDDFTLYLQPNIDPPPKTL